MDINFEWHSSLAQEVQESVETKFKSYVSTYSRFNPCHDGPMLAVMLCSSYNEILVGTVKCSCGILIGSIVCECEGSDIHFSQYDVW